MSHGVATVDTDVNSVQQWPTSQVLDWMTNFGDSKEDIKLKIMNIVQDNDLDGHALKQLRDDTEELHDLIPILKERLTFKAMMRTLFQQYKPAGNFVASQRTPESQSNYGNQNSRVFAAPQSPTQTPSTSLESPPPSHHPVSSHHISQGAHFVTPDKDPQPNTSVMQSSSVTVAVLPAFSSFVSSQSATESPTLVAAASTPIHQGVTDSDVPSGQNDLYSGLYPTALISDNFDSQIPTTQTTIYGGQVGTGSTVSKSSDSLEVQFSYPYSKSVGTTEANSGRYRSIQPYTPVGGYTTPYGRNTRVKAISMDISISKGTKQNKAQEITQKYKKILQRVRSTPPEGNPEHILFPAPIPTFSPILQHQIDKGHLLTFKSRFVYECAQYYMSINHAPSHSDYRNISMTIVSTFPDLADPNNEREPWRSFNTSLSQAIRNIRRRLRSVPGSGFPPAPPRYLRKTPVDRLVNVMDIQQTSTMGVVKHESTNAGPSNPVMLDGDPLECVEMPDEALVGSDDDGDPERKVIIIKTEDVEADVEDIT